MNHYFISKEEAEEILKKRIIDIQEDMSLVDQIECTEDILKALKKIEKNFFSCITLAADIARQNGGEK